MMNKEQKAEPTSKSDNSTKPRVGGSTVKSDCSRHTKDVGGISDMKILAEMMGDLHYEALSKLMDSLAVKIFKDGTKDFNAGRKKLGIALQNTSLYIQKSREFMNEAWEISKPFMSANEG